MKITDLLKPQSILLNASPTNKADAIYTQIGRASCRERV